ncbi:MAG: ABC transporter substrate-binding protein [Vibrio sp.]
MTLKAIRSCLTAMVAVSVGHQAYAAQSDELAQLIHAAQQEGQLTIYASTGKIVQQANAFGQKYHIHATGIKAKAPQIIDIMSREAKAHNVRADVALVEDAPAASMQLLAHHVVVSYLPHDMQSKVAKRYQNPLAVVLAPNVLAYNTAHHATCPITNLWQLTLPKWQGHVAMQDPTGKPAYTDWFNQMAEHADGELRQAYQMQFSKPLMTHEASAMAEFVKRLAHNRPLLTHSDSDSAAAIGSPDAKQDFVGLISTAKFRKNKQGMTLGLCTGVVPVMGWKYPSMGVIATGSQHKASAKLFMHYVLTEQGIAPQSVDGKMSTNRYVHLPSNEASGIEAHREQLMDFNLQTIKYDWEHRQDWQDLWTLSYMQ